MKADRLLSLLLLLQARGRVSARDLAAELEVSRRTVYRDMEALSAAGVPVYAQRGRDGGCCLLRGYRTDATGLSADEARALFVFAGRGALPGTGLEADLRRAMRKLLVALPPAQRPGAEQARDRVVVDPLGWRRRPDDVPWLATIEEAVWSDRCLTLRYRRRDAGVAADRRVDPWGLVVKAGVWYLLAAPDGGDEPRTYRVSRVEGASVLDEASRRPTGLDLEQLWSQLQSARRPGDTVDSTVRVHGTVIDLLLRTSAASTATPAVRRDDPERRGWELVEMRWVALGAAVAHLLGMGPQVEVLEPTELRDAVARTATEVVEVYSEVAAAATGVPRSPARAATIP